MIKFRLFLLFVLLMLPCLAINILLGQRGKLISYIIIIILIYAYNKPIKKVKPKLILIFFIIYFILSFLYANRAIVSLLKDDINEFLNKAFSKERLVKALNPATNEFGVGFANFNELYISDEYKFLLGKSYIEGLAITVPSFMYLGEKPKQITYVFRDQYFYSESLRSSIAGTGFSPILEAYWNFGFLGIFLVYIIYGYVISRLDFYYKRKNVFFFSIYLAISPFVITFHRTAFGDIISSIILKVIVLLIIYVSRTKLEVKKNEF